METKACRKCGIEKDLSEFHKDSNTKDGLAYACKHCRCKYQREYQSQHREHYRRLFAKHRLDHPEQYKWYREEYTKTTQYRIMHSQKAQEYKKSHREAIKAHNKVTKAIISGKLVRPGFCSQCNSTGKIEAHHPDYSKPLEVVFLCVKCHMEEHKRLRSQVVKEQQKG